MACLMVLMVMTMSAGAVNIAGRRHLCEVGLQGGCGYYAGDATPHIFQNVREAYGAHFRYRFDKRWSLQVKGMGQRISGPDYSAKGEKLDTYWTTPMINLDVMGEFNFLRFGSKEYDKRVKPYTPYIFLGVGTSVYGAHYNRAAFYVPVGIGFKWKFSDHCGLNLAWQHNIYAADNLEVRETLNNTYKMNGANIMNCDITSQLTLGIVFEFIREKKICRTCN